MSQQLSELQYDCNDSRLYGLLNNTNNLQFVSIGDDGSTSNIGGAINLNPNEILVEGISTFDVEENRYFFAVLNTVDFGYTIYSVSLGPFSVTSYDVPYSFHVQYSNMFSRIEEKNETINLMESNP